MHPDLTKLLDLQAKDIELFQLDGQIRQLEHELAALDAELILVRDSVSQAQRDIEVETERRDGLESKIEAHRKHQDKRKEKLEFMKTPKDVAGLMAEIDLARGALTAEENDWIKSSDQVTQLEMRKVDAEQRLVAVGQAQEDARGAIARRREELETERAAARSRREASAREVRRPLLQQYDKLRASGGHRAEVVVPLAGAACGACFTTVPVSRRGQIKSGTVIEGCESCGVILYFPD